MINKKPVYFIVETNQNDIIDKKKSLSILEMFVIEGFQNSVNKTNLTYYSKIVCKLNFFAALKKVFIF